MSQESMSLVYRRSLTVLDWTTPSAQFLYLPTVPALSWMRASIEADDGIASRTADIELGVEVGLQRFTGATYTAGVYSGGAWTTFANLSLYLYFDYSTRFMAGRWVDELNPETAIKTLMEKQRDPAKMSSLIEMNTHSNPLVAGETDLRIALTFGPITGVAGTEVSICVQAGMVY